MEAGDGPRSPLEVFLVSVLYIFRAEKAREGLRGRQAKMTGKVSKPPRRQTWQGKETRRGMGCSSAQRSTPGWGHPWSRCRQLHCPWRSLFCPGWGGRAGLEGSYPLSWHVCPAASAPLLKPAHDWRRCSLLSSCGLPPALFLSRCWLPGSQRSPFTLLQNPPPPLSFPQPHCLWASVAGMGWCVQSVLACRPGPWKTLE